ncbi:MAG: DUF885 domain-containing protein [Chitinophagaceae bacterium]|nr:DUF885 domain-containing protein [Chitinophagaceae bacterium]
MIKPVLLSLIALAGIIPASAQQHSSGSAIIDQLLQAISHFQNRENKRDSVLNHPLGSNSEEDHQRRFVFYDSVNTVLNKVNSDTLSFDAKINLELIKYDVEDELSTWKFRSYLNPILADEGFHTGMAAMGSQVLSTKKEFENYIKRLKDIPRSVEERLTLMRKGLQLGICQPRAILNGYENTYQQHIVVDIEKSIFWKPFLKKPFAVSDEDWKKITEEGKIAVQQYAIEGFKKIKTFFDREYLPRTRTSIGVSNFPDGLAYYQERTHHYTTTDLTYEEVYQLGLQEVARIKNEMMNVLKQVDFKGTLQEFITYLRTEPKFYAPTAEQLLKEASYLAKKADGVLPQFFGKLPRQPYGVEPVPAHLAPTYTAGRYSGAPLNSKRAGNYWVNTYDLKSRPLYALESLTLHEAVPGHHLQIALTKELNELPPFRRNLYVNAFGEGWGLYAEYLGYEMGFYKDPYALFGRLTYEMWRACRLVLDVALHTKGWTREQGVAYLAENTALSLHEVNTEINRYISWPGQALAYKMGELKIKEVRRKAEEALKDKFDIREFHDLVLSQGTVTLKILEQMVDRWIAEKSKVKNQN